MRNRSRLSLPHFFARARLIETFRKNADARASSSSLLYTGHRWADGHREWWTRAGFAQPERERKREETSELRSSALLSFRSKQARVGERSRFGSKWIACFFVDVYVQCLTVSSVSFSSTTMGCYFAAALLCVALLHCWCLSWDGLIVGVGFCLVVSRNIFVRR